QPTRARSNGTSRGSAMRSSLRQLHSTATHFARWRCRWKHRCARAVRPEKLHLLEKNPMASYNYRIVNVFAESVLAGNPLCVFEDARGLDDATMQALALQLNLSETTFVLPSTVATARVRIFTPTFEMAFAGHPPP